MGIPAGSHNIRMRPLSERLLHELDQVRGELRATVSSIPNSDLDWAPAPDMKSYRKLLIETAGMLGEVAILLGEGRIHDYFVLKEEIVGETFEELLAILDGYLETVRLWVREATEDHWRTPFAIPDEWAGFYGTKQIEPEEMIRWVARHEYYHLGQILLYRWIQGHNPYNK